MNDFFTDTVLLVEDNETDNFIHKRIIEMAGVAKNFIVKNSGKRPLEFLESKEVIPGVVFLDINMPIVDLFVFLFEYDNFPEEIKQKCKIVILSSSDNKKDIDRIVDNEYVVHFITKPLSEESLNELKTIIKK